MKLSAPIYRLKRQARLLSRRENIPLHQALAQIAQREGHNSWSLLAAQLSNSASSATLYSRLQPGDLLLLAARPGQGKTLLSLEIAVQAMKSGHKSLFFSLEYTHKECIERFESLGIDPSDFAGHFEFDGSDDIDANWIARKLTSAQCGTLVVIDYLQLLDQKRSSPDLMSQVQTLKAVARERGIVFVILSQVDRSYDPLTKTCQTWVTSDYPIHWT